MFNITLKQWIQNFESGRYNSTNIEIQINAGWYDWFCKDTSLVNKTQKLGKKLLQLKNSPKINLDTMYVFFKNNAPLFGNLYDDFHICDIETKNVRYTIIPSEKTKTGKYKASVWGRENNFEKPLIKGSWKNVLNFFNK